MTKPRSPTDKQVDAVMRRGYYTQQFSEYHFRIQGRVDFWPTTGKWFDRAGCKPENRGCGLKPLLAYLAENVPVEGPREPDEPTTEPTEQEAA